MSAGLCKDIHLTSRRHEYLSTCVQESGDGVEISRDRSRGDAYLIAEVFLFSFVTVFFGSSLSKPWSADFDLGPYGVHDV